MGRLVFRKGFPWVPFQPVRDGVPVLRELFARDADFSTRGDTFHGGPGSSWDGVTGEPALAERLPSEWVDHLTRRHLALIDPEYMVFSYDTPIAWRFSGGVWVVPRVVYSVTTSHHQGLVKAVVGDDAVRDVPGDVPAALVSG